MTSGRDVLAHVALALGDYARRARSDGIAVPPEVGALGALLLDAARDRQGSSQRDDLAAGGDAGPVTEPALLTRADVARVLSCSVSTVDRLTSSGELITVRLAGGVRFRRADLDAYVAGLPARDPVVSPFRTRVRTKTTGTGGAPDIAAVRAAVGPVSAPGAGFPTPRSPECNVT